MSSQAEPASRDGDCIGPENRGQSPVTISMAATADTATVTATDTESMIQLIYGDVLHKELYLRLISGKDLTSKTATIVRALENHFVKITISEDGHASYKKHPTFKPYRRLPTELRWKVITLANNTPIDNERYINEILVKQIRFNNGWIYAFKSRFPVPIGFRINRDSRTCSLGNYNVQFKVKIGQEVRYVYIPKNTCIINLLPIKSDAINQKESPQTIITNALRDLKVQSPSTLNWLHDLAVPAPYERMAIRTKTLASGLAELPNLKRVRLLTEYMPSVWSLEKYNKKRPQGDMVFAPSRFGEDENWKFERDLENALLDARFVRDLAELKISCHVLASASKPH